MGEDSQGKPAGLQGVLFRFVFSYFSIGEIIFPIAVHPAVPGPGIDVSFRRVDAVEGGGFLDLLFTNTTTPFV